ncbi:GTP-binding protein [Paracoccus sp. (in: a-proteobacteria)]|uniref:CobW family GTP-binding protein n=1 Tax=Paracoccus sp. TaxID=267 RepID=UPI00321F6A0C
MPLPLPVNIIGGYLGAGKTTLLNRLLTRGDERILVMVNDFGDIPVDAALISRRSAEMIQLSNGCICCSMAGGVMAAFERALDLAGRVDRLIIEASGVAEPQRLTSFALAERDLRCQAVIVVIDPLTLAERLADPRVGRVVEAQIRGADLAWLSRGDVCSRAVMRQAVRLVARLNPLADCHAAVDPAFLQALSRPHDHAGLSAGMPGQDHRRLFAARTIALRPATDLEWLRRTVMAHARHIHRLKGHVAGPGPAGPWLVQLAGGALSLERVGPVDPAFLDRLVAISPDAEALAAFAAEIECGAPPGSTMTATG